MSDVADWTSAGRLFTACECGLVVLVCTLCVSVCPVREYSLPSSFDGKAIGLATIFSFRKKLRDFPHINETSYKY